MILFDCGENLLKHFITSFQTTGEEILDVINVVAQLVTHIRVVAVCRVQCNLNGLSKEILCPCRLRQDLGVICAEITVVSSYQIAKDMDNMAEQPFVTWDPASGQAYNTTRNLDFEVVASKSRRLKRWTCQAIFYCRDGI